MLWTMHPEPDAVTRFWSWFVAHREGFDALTDPESGFWDEALGELQEINDSLYFELSAPVSGVREFVVTADGDETLFATVDAMIAKAPPTTGWKFKALKPAMGFGFKSTYEGIDFDPAEMWFLPLDSAEQPEGLGLRIGFVGLDSMDYDQASSAVVMVLDSGLGERAAAKELQHIELVELPEDPQDAGYIPLAELADYITWRKQLPKAKPRG